MVPDKIRDVGAGGGGGGGQWWTFPETLLGGRIEVGPPAVRWRWRGFRTLATFPTAQGRRRAAAVCRAGTGTEIHDMSTFLGCSRGHMGWWPCCFDKCLLASQTLSWSARPVKWGWICASAPQRGQRPTSRCDAQSALCGQSAVRTERRIWQCVSTLGTATTLHLRSAVRPGTTSEVEVQWGEGDCEGCVGFFSTGMFAMLALGGGQKSAECKSCLIWATTNTITATTVLLWQKQPHLLWVSSTFEHLAPKSRVRFWNISKWGWNTLSAVTWKRWWRNSAVLRLSDHLLRQNIRLSSALIWIVRNGEANWRSKQGWSEWLNAKFCEFFSQPRDALLLRLSSPICCAKNFGAKFWKKCLWALMQVSWWWSLCIPIQYVNIKVMIFQNGWWLISIILNTLALLLVDTQLMCDVAFMWQKSWINFH